MKGNGLVHLGAPGRGVASQSRVLTARTKEEEEEEEEGPEDDSSVVLTLLLGSLISCREFKVSP